MKSLCIKTNNSIFLNKLFDLLKDSFLEDTYFSCNEFKYYKNLIIHYTGKNTETFLCDFCSILSCLVIDFYEQSFLKQIITSNYFYFNNLERKQILDITNELLTYEQEEFSIIDRHTLLLELFYDYLKDNKNIILDGVLNFRIKDYFKTLDFTIDLAVNKYIVEKEYSEFISLLKLYINSQPTNSEIVHLVYVDNNTILLDNNKNIINVNNYIFNAKYLSDISFSSNDYTLNTLLTLLPEKIFIHVVDDCFDEFINTLKLVFENRIQLCNDCSICRLYKQTSIITKKQ